MLTHFYLSLIQIFSKPMRSLFWKMLGATFLTLIVLAISLQKAFTYIFVWKTYPYIEKTIEILATLGLIFGSVFLISPVSSLIAGFFADNVGEQVEAKHYPNSKGAPLPFNTAMVESLKFGAMALIINFFALILFFTGIGILAFFFANAYLLSREYFETLAMRFMPPLEAKALRRKHALKIFLYGLPLGGLMLIPLFNLLTPLLGLTLLSHAVQEIRPWKAISPQ
jgi:CysZ protein